MRSSLTPGPYEATRLICEEMRVAGSGREWKGQVWGGMREAGMDEAPRGARFSRPRGLAREMHEAQQKGLRRKAPSPSCASRPRREAQRDRRLSVP